MIVYVGQCGEVYEGPTFPQYHGVECDLAANHEGHRHTARVVIPQWFKTEPGERTYCFDRIEWWDAKQKTQRVA